MRFIMTLDRLGEILKEHSDTVNENVSEDADLVRIFVENRHVNLVFEEPCPLTDEERSFYDAIDERVKKWKLDQHHPFAGKCFVPDDENDRFRKLKDAVFNLNLIRNGSESINDIRLSAGNPPMNNE